MNTEQNISTSLVQTTLPKTKHTQKHTVQLQLVYICTTICHWHSLCFMDASTKQAQLQFCALKLSCLEGQPVNITNLATLQFQVYAAHFSAECPFQSSQQQVAKM